MKTQKQIKEYWESYWKTVKSCRAFLTGHTEIEHTDGSIEYFDPRGKKIADKRF